MSKINKITLKDVSKQNKYKIEESVVYTPYEIYEAQNTFIAYVTPDLCVDLEVSEPEGKCADSKSNRHREDLVAALFDPILGLWIPTETKWAATSDHLCLKDACSAQTGRQRDQ